MTSTVKTILILGFLSILIVMLGGLIGGRQGVTTAFFISLLMNGGMYFFSDKMALSMSGAQPMDQKKYPEIYEMVSQLSKRIQIPMPALYITPDMQANAFATGRGPGNSSVAVTQGILQTLDKDELAGVLAHELAHIKNRDVLVATIAAVLASTISYIGNMGMYGGFQSDDEGNRTSPIVMILASILVPIGASLLQMAVSRQREFGADETGAHTMGSGDALASALQKIHQSARRTPLSAPPAIASLYIGDPTGGIGSKLMHLFSTHPPVEERIKRLKSLKITTR